MSERDDARRLLRELLPELLQEALARTGNGDGAGRASRRRRWPPCCGRRRGAGRPWPAR